VKLTVDDTADEQHDSILASLPVGTNIGALSVTTIGSGLWLETMTCVEMTAAPDA